MDIANLKPIIISALSSLNIPVVPIFYPGTARTYITFNTVNDSETDFADDEAIKASQTVNIHLYSDTDYVSLLNIIKKNLKDNGFERIQISYETYEKDTELYHVTIGAIYEY